MLAAWKNVYPAELTPDAWVFLSSRKEAMNYAQIRQRMKMAAERAGLEKRVHLHLFRKSRATHMIQQNYQESVIKKMLWGNLGTQMFRTYVVLSEADIDAEILGQAGIETPGGGSRTRSRRSRARTATPSARRPRGSARPAARRSRPRPARSWRARRGSSGRTRRRSSSWRRRSAPSGGSSPSRRERPPDRRPDRAGPGRCPPACFSHFRETGYAAPRAAAAPDLLMRAAAEARSRPDRAAARALRAPVSG